MDHSLQLLSFLVLGVWTSQVLYGGSRSRRLGLALGLGLHVLGLAAVVAVAFWRGSALRLTRRDWVLWGLIALVAVWLTWANGQVWGQPNLDVLLLWALIVVGFLDAWRKSEGLSNLAPAFWVLVGMGAAITTALFGTRGTDEGAYLGAWAWIVGGLVLELIVPRSENRRQIRVSVRGIDIPRALGHYPVRGPLALLALTLLFLACLFAGYAYTTDLDPRVYAFMVYVVMAGSALALFLLFMAVVSLVVGVVGIGRYLLRPPARLCPRCGATHTDIERQIEALSPGYVQLQCPGCGKAWKQARLRW